MKKPPLKVRNFIIFFKISSLYFCCNTALSSETITQQAITESLGLCGPAFAALSKIQPRTKSGVLRFMGRKLETRLLGVGGPIGQPEFFLAIRSDENTIARLQKAHGDILTIGSADLGPVGRKRALSAEAIGTHIVNGSIKLPLVFKPNDGADGNNIMFIEREGGMVSMTISDSSSQYHSAKKVVAQVRETGVTNIHRHKKQGLTRILIDPKQQDISKVFLSAWRVMSTTEFSFRHKGEDRQVVKYDAGMVESMFDSFKPGGKAYETRHKFRAKPDGDVTKLVKTPGEDDDGFALGSLGSFARVGTSSYFSNQFGRDSKKILPWDKIYSPIFKGFGITPDKQHEFISYADDLVKRQVSHYFQRLLESGENLEGNISGHLDLAWLPPEKQGDFPVPIVVEVYFEPQ